MQEFDNKEANLRRLPGDDCKVPNSSLFNISELSDKPSVLAFSSSGRKLAVAWGDIEDNFEVAILFSKEWFFVLQQPVKTQTYQIELGPFCAR